MPRLLDRAQARTPSGLVVPLPSGYVLDEEHTAVTVENTTAETTLFTLTCPASTVAAGDLLRVVAGGTLLNSTAGAVTFTWRVKIGATTVIPFAALSVAQNANNREWRMEGDIQLGATVSEQDVGWSIFVSNANAAAGAFGGDHGHGVGGATEDMSASTNIVVTLQMGTASVNAEQVPQYANLHLFKKAA